MTNCRLRGKERRYLRGLGNALGPTVYLGKEGLSVAVIRLLNEA
ncbi:MAG: YhbY family RNA-binding protein [Gemmatimonadetes bacterium]|nr:YhbY family RNA-binding protein [Gemmatimonadota bacterium]